MPELFRTRDVVVLAKGITYTCAASPLMIQNGWAGGQGLRWDDSPLDEFRVHYTDGVRGAGFALWGSNENSDQLTSTTGYQTEYGHLVVCAGSWLIMTGVYEQYTLASRLVPPLVPITYAVGDHLYWSLRGLWTKEDEWTISGDPRAPNTNAVANVIQVPSAANNGFMTLQTTL